MNNYAEFFPILHYKKGVLTRVNGDKSIPVGSFCLLPLFSICQDTCLKIDRIDVHINGKDNSGYLNFKRPAKLLSLQTTEELDLPEECFLIAARYSGGYTIEELEDINKIWESLLVKYNLIWKLK